MIKVNGVWKTAAFKKILVGGSWKEIAGGWIIVGGVWKRIWPPTIAPSAGEEWWMYFDFDPFTMTAEDNFLKTEVFS